MEIIPFLEKSYPQGINFEGDDGQKDELIFSIIDDYINSEPEQKNVSYGEIAEAQSWIVKNIK